MSRRLREVGGRVDFGLILSVLDYYIYIYTPPTPPHLIPNRPAHLPPCLSFLPRCLSLASSWSTLTQIFLDSSVHLNRTPRVRLKINRCRTVLRVLGLEGILKQLGHC